MYRTKIGGSARRRVAGILRPHRTRLAVALVLTGLACLLNLPVPLLIRDVVDRAASGSRAALPWFAAGLLACFAAQAAASLLATLVMGRVGLDVVRDLRRRL